MPRLPAVYPERQQETAPREEDRIPQFEEPAPQEPGPDALVLAAGATAYYQTDWL